MIASLAWYPAARPAWEALWSATRAHLGFGPAALAWPDDFAAHWRDPGLLLSMTCALPMQLGLADHVHTVATPVWSLPGLPPGTYASHLVTRADDDRPLAEAAAAGLAVNARDSQSGYGTLRQAGLHGPVLVTGSHAASIRAVAGGRAHLAAIDVVTWSLAPNARLAVRATTPPTSATPFVTARAEWVAPLRAALAAAIADHPHGATRLTGLVHLPPASYATRPATALGSA